MMLHVIGYRLSDGEVICIDCAEGCDDIMIISARPIWDSDNLKDGAADKCCYCETVIGQGEIENDIPDC